MLFLTVAAIVQPFILPAQFIQSRWFVLLFAMLPFGGLIVWVSDSFAGERERHTLEALLLAPVSDQSIIGGKILAILIYTAILLVAVLTALLFGQLIIGQFNIDLTWYGFVFCVALLLYLIFISVGIMATWSASSLQVAQQTIVYFIAGPIIILPIIIPLVWSYITEIFIFISQTTFVRNGYLPFAAVLIVIIFTISSLLLALVRFKRERMLLL
jgi:ABC-2 type transport system permease protein